MVMAQSCRNGRWRRGSRGPERTRRVVTLSVRRRGHNLDKDIPQWWNIPTFRRIIAHTRESKSSAIIKWAKLTIGVKR